jgi:hypothetical protein
MAVPLLIPPCGGFGFRSETATWIRKWFKYPLELLESSGYNSFQDGGDGCGYRYRNMSEIPPRAYGYIGHVLPKNSIEETTPIITAFKIRFSRRGNNKPLNRLPSEVRVLFFD